jgi:hypothetical protein
MGIINNAWLSYRANVMPKHAGTIQVMETRQAFFAGAATLFATITGESFLDGDPGDGDIEPTKMDLAKMEAIQDEINVFGAELDLKILRPEKH